MLREHAEQIAALLNRRNRLTIPFDAERVLERAADFLYVQDDHGDVLGCVEIRKVQWYQWEICHLTVAEGYERKGYGRALISRAERRAVEGRARILQCTIRVGNSESEELFRKCKYQAVSTFYYPDSGNDVAVWQKVVCRRVKAPLRSG